MSTPPSPLSRDDLRDLLTEAVALEYLKFSEKKSSEKDAKEQKPLWLQVMESTGFATLVTVLIGGLIGTGVTYMFQAWAKDREQSLSIAQSHRERDLAAFNQHLDRERKTIDEMALKLGAFVDGASDLAELSRREWNKRNRAKDRHDIVRHFNNAASQWHADRVRLSLLLELEHETDPELRKDFRAISERVDEYARCADRWRTVYITLSATEAQNACVGFRNNLDAVIATFADRLVTLRAAAVKSQLPAEPSQQRNIPIARIALLFGSAAVILLVVWAIRFVSTRGRAAKPSS